MVFEVFCFECFRSPLPFGKLYSPVPRMQKNRVKIFAPSLPDFFILISILMLLLSQSPFYYARKSALLSITLLPAVHPGQSQYSIPFARSASSCARIPAATSSPRCFTKSFSSLVMVEKLLILILWLTCQINTQSPENICIHRRQDNRAMRITIL